MADIKVTLETLYDILRNEKKKEELQELESSFFVDVVAYLREKKALLEQKSGQDELFAGTEREKLEYELRSIKRILKEIYEKREKKLIDIAMNKSRTRSDIIDTSCMLREEKEFFDSLVNHLDKYRCGVLLNLFKGNLPFVDKDFSVKKLLTRVSVPKPEPELTAEPEVEEETSKSSNSSFNEFEGVEASVPDTEPGGDGPDEEYNMPEDELDTENASEPEETTEEPATEESETKLKGQEPEQEPKETPEKEEDPETKQEETKEESKDKEKEKTPEPEPKQDMTKIKFVHPVPKFIWKDMKEYGPFDPGEETEIFPEVADLLVRKGRAEKV
ncbi:MAG: hypothetical protein ABIG93_02965 [archaeon]|nr:hypothetical protein [Nanoarchaeota archaeon]